MTTTTEVYAPPAPDHAMPPRSIHSARRSRAHYLDTALALAERRPAAGVTPHAYVVAHVDVAQVAEAAGVSRTALYRLWDTQEAFRADLVALLAATDEAPGLRLGPSPAATPPGRAPALDPAAVVDPVAAVGDRRALLRAGIAGYPGAAAVTAVLAHGERDRLARHAAHLAATLAAAGRRCRPGLTPAGLGAAVACLADGVALAAATTPEATDPRLVAAGVGALLAGLTEPAGSAPAPGPADDGGATPVAGSEPAPAAWAWRGAPTGRRLHYLRVAAGLAAETRGSGPADGGALGYVGLDTLARAEGVTRAAVRKLWPTQAAFRADLYGHLLARHGDAVTGALAGGPDGRGGAGARLFDALGTDPDRASHLAFAPQLVVPAFRAAARRHAEARLERTAVALAGGRAQAVLALALVDGATRLARTRPGAIGRTAFAAAFSQITQPTHPTT
jgi:AcrR family transcriptional regulator